MNSLSQIHYYFEKKNHQKERSLPKNNLQKLSQLPASLKGA
jgi:hypothetical protein